jgi:cytidine deaminase
MTLERSDLLDAAILARERAYAPYSQFRVGAALLAADGRVFTGANAENASYGLSMCAERVAIYHALSEGVQHFKAVAVAGPDGVRTMPCGACRQVLHEFGAAMQVIFADDGRLRVMPLTSLLPEAFGRDDLDSAPPEGVVPLGNAR